MSLYEERLNRVRAAVALEEVDKIPFMSGGPAAMAAYEGVKLADFCNDMELNSSTIIKFSNDFNVDGSQAVLFNPRILCRQWLSEVLLPGAGKVPENDLWQIEEKERMTQDDYDKILSMGYQAWEDEFVHKFYGSIPDEAQSYFDYYPTALQRAKEAGIPSFVDAIFYAPVERLCGARSLPVFLMDDIMEIPEKVEEVCDFMHKELMQGYENMVKDPKTRPLGVWIGGWRGTPSTFSPAMFETFSWKYMRDYIDLCIQYDVIPICHLDSDWNRAIPKFKEFQPGKVVVALDGSTDIFAAADILRGHSCLMGDVPAQMLAFGKKEDVYAYCKKLIQEVGPKGYIMCSGCDVPYNANFDNVRQMQYAVENHAKGQL